MNDINKDQLKDLIKDSYIQGQIDGMNLACEQISTAILQFKELIVKMQVKESDESNAN